MSQINHITTFRCYLCGYAKIFICSLILSSCSSDSENQSPLETEKTFAVSVTEVIEQDVPVYVETIGHVISSHHVDIRPQVNGTIVEVFIKGGDRVQTGDPLYQIDRTPYEIALEITQANLIKAKAELEYSKIKLERYSKLVKSEYVSKINLDELKRDVQRQEWQVKIDQAQFDQAKINLDYCDVISPIEGVVGLTKVDRGNIVQANDPQALITILNVNPIDVEFCLSQKDFQELRVVLREEGSRKFKVKLPYGAEKDLEGDLIAFNNQINLNTGTIQLKGRLANAQEFLWPGQFVKVELYYYTKTQVPLIPACAVQTSQKGCFVYVLNPDQTVKYTPVIVGEKLGDLVVIKEGLKKGVNVVKDGQMNLKPGAKVLISNEIYTKGKN